jgi:hypothetical protein
MKLGFKQEVCEKGAPAFPPMDACLKLNAVLLPALARLLKKAAAGDRPKAASLFTVLDKDLAGRLYLLDLRASKENLCGLPKPLF